MPKKPYLDDRELRLARHYSLVAQALLEEAMDLLGRRHGQTVAVTGRARKAFAKAQELSEALARERPVESTDQHDWEPRTVGAQVLQVEVPGEMPVPPRLPQHEPEHATNGHAGPGTGVWSHPVATGGAVEPFERPAETPEQRHRRQHPQQPLYATPAASAPALQPPPGLFPGAQ